MFDKDLILIGFGKIQFEPAAILCDGPEIQPYGYVLFFCLNLLGFFLCVGTLIATKIIPAINIVINRLLFLLLFISCLQSIANCTIGTFLLRGCTFDYFYEGWDTPVSRMYSLVSSWTLLMFSAVVYEISRMRFYYAKHAVRIHKISPTCISWQVLCEPLLVSTAYLGTLSFFSNPSLFPAFSSTDGVDLEQVLKSGMDSAILVLLPMFLLDMVAIVYYFKLYKHVKKKVGISTPGHQYYLYSKVVTKYVVTGGQTEAEEYKTQRHFSPELCFLSLIYGQFVFQLVYIIILTFQNNFYTSGCLGIILASLTTNIVFPLCLLIPATRDICIGDAQDTDSSASAERWERRLGAVSKHKRRLARTRQIFKLPRFSSIKRIKESISSDGNKIWTVTAQDPESNLDLTKLEMKTTAWASGMDTEPVRNTPFNSQLRIPFKGQNKDDIEFTDIGAIEETRNKSRGVEKSQEKRNTRRIIRQPCERKTITTVREINPDHPAVGSRRFGGRKGRTNATQEEWR